MSVDLHDFAAVVADEVKFHPHEAEGTIRYPLTARAVKRNALGHQTRADE
jgi:hypothetical protein